MDRVPPKIVRRLVLAPVVLAVSLALIALSPALLLIGAVADLFLPGNWRTVRVLAFGVAYLVFEVMGLLALFGLWVRSGFGSGIGSERIQDAHFRFMRWWLKGLNRVAGAAFRLQIEIEDRPQPRPGPVLVFSRHAGPGNSMMLIGTLMIAYRRRPRIVMLAKLQWEPLCDIMLNRLPNRFIKHDSKNRHRYIEAISELAAGLDEHDAFVLFPEGHDFTIPLRLRAIAHLRRKGHLEEAEKAERMANVLPPRHGGTLAAIRSAPRADVVFVAHTVREDIGSFGDLWRRVPFEGPIRSRYWRIPPSEVPESEAEQIDWLFEWWQRIDRWIAERIAASGKGRQLLAEEGSRQRPTV